MKYIIKVFFIFISFNVFAMDWPSKDAVLYENFGFNEIGGPKLGGRFSGSGQVQTIDSGEVVFKRGTKKDVSRLPCPLGEFVALDHGDGLIGLYGRLEDGSSTDLPVIVEKDAVIALAGRSGWAKEQGFYFSIYDKKEKRWVNPAIIISPPPDSRPPSINAVKLVDSEKQVFDTASTRRLKQGLYFINVQAQDTVQSALDKPLMPHRITTSINGSETETLSFETFFARDGMLMMYRNSLIPVSQIYAPYPLIEAGEVWFNRGQATLEITVHDVFGNSRRSVFNLFVE